MLLTQLRVVIMNFLFFFPGFIGGKMNFHIIKRDSAAWGGLQAALSLEKAYPLWDPTLENPATTLSHLLSGRLLGLQAYLVLEGVSCVFLIAVLGGTE